ncbi:uncharacterized protein LOC133737988 [Rosa rugosa]|uniref:uncharacterized protein LOC133737988 n=1 Tax=Rosa rugosa TaxID=74645 RepID=UPI002B414CA0|nr:uncharacterized protein LOC133737988 [Rosa rugosa]
MEKNSCVWFVLGLAILIVSTEFVQVDCRALRSESATGEGCKEQAGGAEEMAGMGSFAVSSSFNSSSNDNSTHRPSHDELFAAIFGELRYPYLADVDLLARVPEDAAQVPPPAAEPAPRPARAQRQAQAGIVIREPPQEGNAPSFGSRAANTFQATGQTGKQKAVMTGPEDNESSSDDDDSQTVRHRSSRHTEEGSSAAGEGPSASQAQAPTIVNNFPPPAGAASNAQLASVPVQIIDDSSPEAEDRVPPPDAPHEEPSDIPVLEQIAPDSIPVPSEANPEAMPAVVEHEPPAEENPNAFNTEDAEAEAVEAEAAEPALSMVGQEPLPPAPQVTEAGGLGNLPEPMPEAAPVAEPPEVPVAEQPTSSTLERLKR